VQAVAIERPDFDRHLAERAREAGAQIRMGRRAYRFERTGGQIEVVAANGKGPEKMVAPILIGADGVLSQVARWLEAGSQLPFVPAIKADVRFRGAGTEHIEVFVGNAVAPGWFGWVIPLADGIARVGIGARTRRANDCFRHFLGVVRDKFGEFEILNQRGWLIPMAPLRRISFDNAMLVGDAARQAKPSSGGGIYMGMRAGELAAEAALQALASVPTREQLKAYEGFWQAEEGEELRYNHWLRTIYNRMNDEEIDRMVDLCNRPWAQLAIRRLGDIDFASRLFRPVHLALEAVAPLLLSRLSDRLRSPAGGSISEDLASLELDPESLLATVRE
jgi:flavin-dependent dehydrogenase